MVQMEQIVVTARINIETLKIYMKLFVIIMFSVMRTDVDVY